MNQTTKRKDLSSEEKSSAIKKILLPALVIALFVAIILSYYNMLYSQTRDSIIKDGQTAAMQSADYLNEYLSVNINAVKLTVYMLDNMIAEGRTNSEILEYLKWQATAVNSTVLENLTEIYGYINGEFIISNQWQPDANFVATERPWYTEPMANNGNVTIVDPYLDVLSGTINMAVGKRLADGKSVVSIDVALDKIQKITEESVESGKVDYELILDGHNKVVAHSDRNEVGKDYGNETDSFWGLMLNKARSTDEDFFELDYNDSHYVVYSAKIEDNWRCLFVKDATEIFSPLKRLLIITIAVVVAIVLILSYILNKSIKRYHIAEHLNEELSSLSNIYLFVYEVDIVKNTFKVIKTEASADDELSEDENKSASSILEDFIRQKVDDTFLKETLFFVDISTLNERLRDFKTVAIEYRNNVNKWRRARFISTRRRKDGTVTHVLWLIEDIDKEKTEQDILINLSERAFAASEAKSSFLSNMSHEIRTPINAILGMNEMILRECEDTEILAYSESVKTAGNTLLGLVNDILDFSKIEAGKIEIIPVNYDLSSLINNLVNMIQIKADDKGLTLNLDFDKDLPKLLHGDEIRIKQVITNILTNSVKYTKKGSITFSIGFKRIADDPDSVILLVSVKDTGIGIKQEDMKKLFMEFERIEEERNRNVEGTGLGMAITKNLLYLMETTLQVESVYGAGTTFSFELKQKVVKWEPLGDSEESYKLTLSANKKYKEKFTAPNAQVLVVDDNPMNLMVFKSLLKKTKVKIDMANGGDEALLLTQDKKYD